VPDRRRLRLRANAAFVARLCRGQVDATARAARDRTMSLPVCAPGALARRWAESGFTDIDQRSLMIRLDFTDFSDYWEPFKSGEGALGDYVVSLDGAPGSTSSATCVRPI